jgi:succinylglutamate desuccinylase
MLREFHELPDGILDLPASQLHDRLGGPTLVHLEGRRGPALFVAVLMHGNETTGWEAIRTLLKGYLDPPEQRPLPRSISLFIGNTKAAAAAVRHLPDQPDFNRVWPGSERSGTPEHALMRQVMDRMAKRGVFASVDIHNNTGINPHYACVNHIETRALHLAAMFSRTVVYFVRPRGVASMAMAELCPAVTLECGKVGTEHGLSHVLDYLDACLRLSEHPTHPVAVHDVDLYHTVAIVKVPPSVSFGFGDQGDDIRFAEDVDAFNFREIAAGTAFGTVLNGAQFPLSVRDESDQDVAERYFEIADGQLRLRCPVMPSMLTCDATVIRQDCLCYLMERYDEHLSEATAQ